tara:strand:+ start:1472 stop:1792 length:321 start_codon:yes stop_codon:yes gene_type:complete
MIETVSPGFMEGFRIFIPDRVIVSVLILRLMRPRSGYQYFETLKSLVLSYYIVQPSCLDSVVYLGVPVFTLLGTIPTPLEANTPHPTRLYSRPDVHIGYLHMPKLA